ncbi:MULTISPECIES: hypothetical protein [Actinoplanes]|uniref:hypothetical protein n=1 Tax=Actinoplanes TaxID=1865 RepID=UPI0005F2BB96|nr:MULTISPECIES: hypothetical protein [Actinoplanes]GLY06134.1 hypothetical protein Acsp01_65130 [Actinoplanes sp. NBRC 101535]
MKRRPRGAPQLHEAAWLHFPGVYPGPVSLLRLEKAAGSGGWEVILDRDLRLGTQERGRFATEAAARNRIEQIYAGTAEGGEWRVRRYQPHPPAR